MFKKIQVRFIEYYLLHKISMLQIKYGMLVDVPATSRLRSASMNKLSVCVTLKLRNCKLIEILTYFYDTS